MSYPICFVSLGPGDPELITLKEKVILLYLPFETGFPVLLTGQG